MHITLESDYAVRIVYCLAQNGGRMEAAAIAEQTGFASAAHFRRVFREVMDISPLQYRKKQRK